ncbi:MAG: hypothetical protein QXX68_02555 [Candidatus Pacearchaeota archaeon]
MKKKERKKVIVIIFTSFLILAFLLLLLTNLNRDNKQIRGVEAKEVECYKDSDCLIIRGSCCPCNNGGSPQCIPQKNLLEFTRALEKCSSKGACFNEDCGKISCGCVNNKCVGQRI